MRRLDGERRVVFADQLLADGTGTEAGDVFRLGLRQRQARADAMRGVVHRRQTRPVIRPTVHVLLMARLQELDFAQLALLVHLLDEQKFAGIDDGFGHHVFQARLLD